MTQCPSSDLLCCPVSQDPYKPAGPRRPRILPCGHSVSHVSLASILRQSSSTSRRCPICRKQLHDTSATAYPINITLLEVLDAADEADDDYSPRLVRMDNLGAHPSLASHASMAGSPPSSQHTDHVQTTLPPPPVHVRPLPEGSAGAASVDVSDEDAATRAAGEAAALLPWEGWLVQRAGVRLAAVGLLPALRAGRGTVPAMVWGRVVAKYRLPGAFVKKFVEDSARRVWAWPGDRAGLQEEEDSRPLWRGHGFVTHVQRLPSSLRVTHESDLTAPGDGPSAEQLCRADVQKAVLPHVVPQLLPSVAPHMLPLLGFYIESEHADTHVCHVYADVGDTLAGRFFCTPGRGVAERHCEAVSILIGLAGLLSTLHSLSLSADQFCPLQPSSIRVDPSPDSMHALDVRLAPAAARDHTYERVRTSARDRGVIPQCLLDADGLCSSPPGHAGARGTLSAGGTRAQDRMAADVWRLGALGGVLLASTAYCGDAAARVARAGTALELLEGLSGDGRFTDLLTTLRGCLAEDPRQRWSADAVWDALTRLPSLVHAHNAMLRPPGLQTLRRDGSGDTSASDTAPAPQHAAQRSARPGGRRGRTHTRVLTRSREAGAEAAGAGDVEQSPRQEMEVRPAGKCQMSTTVRACSCGVVLCFVMCTLGRIVSL